MHLIFAQKGWKIISEMSPLLSQMKGDIIKDISRLLIHNTSIQDLKDFEKKMTEKNFEDQDVIAKGGGVIVIHTVSGISLYLLNKIGVDLYANTELNQMELEKLYKEGLVSSKLEISSIKHPQYTNNTIKKILNKKINNINIIQIHPLTTSMARKKYQCLTGIELELEDGGKFVIGCLLGKETYDFIIMESDEVKEENIKERIPV